MLISPYAFYLYDYFPDTKTYEFFGIPFTSNYYESVRSFIHTVFSKIIPLLFLLIWFTTCKHWWYYSIGIPISVYIFQLISALNDDIMFVDKYEFIYSLPFTIVIIGLLLGIRSKISIYLKALDLKTEVENVINEGIKRRREQGYEQEYTPKE